MTTHPRWFDLEYWRKLRERAEREAEASKRDAATKKQKRTS
jgi:hypothetical protein